MKSTLLQSLFFSAVLLITGFLAPNKAQAQACTNNNVTVSFAMGAQTSPTTYEFDVMMTNTAAAGNVAKLAGFTGGIQYDAASFPAGATLTLSAVTQPSAADFPGMNNIAPSVNATTRNLRWSQINITEPTSVPMPLGVTKKYARVKVTSTLPFTASTVNLNFVPVSMTGLVSCNAIVYCNANPSSASLTVTNAYLVLGTPLAIALPIELTDFSGETLESTNMLHWKTASEINVKNFEIERSIDGVANWKTIGTKTAAGNSNVEKVYELEDRSPVTVGYYRLKSVDFDAKTQLSNVVVLTRRTKFGVASAFPIPTLDKVNVQFETLEEGNITLNITDLAGRLVSTQQLDAISGMNTVELSLGTLPAGAYFMTIDNGSTVSAPVQLVKQ